MLHAGGSRAIGASLRIVFGRPHRRLDVFVSSALPNGKVKRASGDSKYASESLVLAS